MLKHILGSVLAAGVLLAAAPAFAQFGGTCSREDLQSVTDAYFKAQAVGDPITIPMNLWVEYTEQMETANFANGVISHPQKIDFHRTLVDTTSCQTFSEVIITDPAHPYVLGVLLSARGGRVGGVEMVITDKDDWLFNASNTLKYSQAETWGVIPEGQRATRQQLIAAADAYLNLFNDKTVQVPWGDPCERLEGGMYTGKGAPGVSLPGDSCSVGVPSGVKIVERRYVVDETLGAVAVLNQFGNNSLPDVHTFRVENGKLRYVHTITVCKSPNCGFPARPPQQPAPAAGG